MEIEVVGRTHALEEALRLVRKHHPDLLVVDLYGPGVADAIAEKADLTRADAKKALTALEEVILEQISEAEKVKIGGVVQLTVRLKPARPARPGRNPATGEEITIAAKPESVDVKARALTKAKGALPSVQKAKRVLG